MMKRIALCLLLALLSTSAHAALGGLIVKCNVEGAKVLLDGNDKGACPIRIFTTPGQHTLELKQVNGDGSYYYYRTQVNLPAGEPEKINAELAINYPEEYWYGKAVSTKQITAWDEYLRRYPNGSHSDEVHRILENHLGVALINKNYFITKQFVDSFFSSVLQSNRRDMSRAVR